MQQNREKMKSKGAERAKEGSQENGHQFRRADGGNANITSGAVV